LAISNQARPSGRRAIVLLQGGWGNQLFQLCAGETIRQRTGHPVYYDCDLMFRNEPYRRQFELENMVPPEQRISVRSSRGYWRLALFAKMQATAEKHLMRRVGMSSLPLSVVLRIVNWWPGSEVLCRGHYQSLEFIDSACVERIREAMRAPQVDRNCDVAVHFRQSRDLYASGAVAPDHANTVLRLEYYRESLRLVRERLGAVRFRVFSDRGAIPEDVFQPSDNVVLDGPRQPERAWDTLARLASCRHFIVANSTFSWWGAFLGRSPDKQVYAPKNWRFANGFPCQRGIFPEGWRRI
jgi:hypothetical protein